MFNDYFLKGHLKEPYVANLKTPITHWIMMGLQNGGRYSYDDYEYTRSFPIENRSNACTDKIKERLNGMSYKDLADLLKEKTLICFGDGTLNESEFLDDYPQNVTKLHDLILFEGSKYKNYSEYCTSILLSIYLFSIIGQTLAAVRKYKYSDLTVVPPLSMMGLWMFLMMWETNSRYITNYSCIMVICCITGLKILNDFFSKT
jgi:hypothetical protein